MCARRRHKHDHVTNSGKQSHTEIGSGSPKKKLKSQDTIDWDESLSRDCCYCCYYTDNHVAADETSHFCKCKIVNVFKI